jgi:hypothetical protein
MTSHTHLPAIRQPATRVATGTLAALLLAAFAQPSSASDADTRVGPEPHWSSRIGTGQPYATGSERGQAREGSTAPSRDASASAHWSALIGTGRAVAESNSTPVGSRIAGVAPPPHWTAHIGTGHASPEVAAVRKLAERQATASAIAPPAQPAVAEPLGQHPAVLVAESWSRRGINPNTFIVQHPAGPIWVNAAAPATKNVMSDPNARAIKTASAPKR